jgi:hypothetical protein
MTTLPTLNREGRSSNQNSQNPKRKRVLPRLRTQGWSISPRLKGRSPLRNKDRMAGIGVLPQHLLIILLLDRTRTSTTG